MVLLAGPFLVDANGIRSARSEYARHSGIIRVFNSTRASFRSLDGRRKERAPLGMFGDLE